MPNTKIIHAVIGPTFGDEGKGKQVSYLVREIRRVTHRQAAVVRFQGGCQAGHTVYSQGVRHVFGHIGSGALEGAPTILTRDFIFNPMILAKERRELQHKLITPHQRNTCNTTIFVDPRAIVTTPIEMILNQIIEQLRGSARHGSCGLGINETIRRHEDYCALRVCDVFKFTRDETVHLFEALAGEWMPKRLADLGFDAETIEAALEPLTKTMVRGLGVTFHQTIRGDLGDVIVEKDTAVMSRYPALIFEGAQGLLLDEDHEFFPHVTHSHTGLTNIVPLLKEMGEPHIAVTYPIRWYMTRHGAGPFPTETFELPSPTFEDDTNQPNDWQGTLRFGAMDIGLVRRAIYQDVVTAARNGIEIEGLTMVLNCLDQLPPGQKIPLRWDGEDIQWTPLVLLNWWSFWLTKTGASGTLADADVKVAPSFMMGYGPDADDIHPTPIGFPNAYIHETTEVPS